MPFDPVLTFKILVLWMLNNLSDERPEELISDCVLCIGFLNLYLLERVPEAKTVWQSQSVGPRQARSCVLSRGNEAL